MRSMDTFNMQFKTHQLSFEHLIYTYTFLRVFIYICISYVCFIACFYFILVFIMKHFVMLCALER